MGYTLSGDTSCWSAAERANFPTDLYMLEGLIRQLGSKYVLRLADNDSEISSSIGADVAVVVLTHVSYRTGRMLDMAKYTRLAHEAYEPLYFCHAKSKPVLPMHNIAQTSAWPLSR